MSASQKTFDADVAIIGYGPSGLAAALSLGHYGIRTIAFERDREIYPRARAVTVNDWTMRCFQSLGLDEELARTMDADLADTGEAGALLRALAELTVERRY